MKTSAKVCTITKTNHKWLFCSIFGTKHGSNSISRCRQCSLFCVALVVQRICYSIIIPRLIYAISVWEGFLSAKLTGRIDAFLRRLFRYGYTSTLLNIEDLLADADETLFIKVLRPGHCLHQLLPERKLVSMNLRPSNHSFQLPICKYVCYKCAFNTL